MSLTTEQIRKEYVVFPLLKQITINQTIDIFKTAHSILDLIKYFTELEDILEHFAFDPRLVEKIYPLMRGINPYLKVDMIGHNLLIEMDKCSKPEVTDARRVEVWGILQDLDAIGPMEFVTSLECAIKNTQELDYDTYLKIHNTFSNFFWRRYEMYLKLNPQPSIEELLVVSKLWEKWFECANATKMFVNFANLYYMCSDKREQLARYQSLDVFVKNLGVDFFTNASNKRKNLEISPTIQPVPDVPTNRREEVFDRASEEANVENIIIKNDLQSYLDRNQKQPINGDNEVPRHINVAVLVKSNHISDEESRRDLMKLHEDLAKNNIPTGRAEFGKQIPTRPTDAKQRFPNQAQKRMFIVHTGTRKSPSMCMLCGNTSLWLCPSQCGHYIICETCCDFASKCDTCGSLHHA